MKKSIIVLALSSLLSSCASTAGYYAYYLLGAGAYGTYWWLTRPTVGRAIDDAVALQTPNDKERMPTSSVEVGSGRLATHSYTTKDKQLCFLHFAKSNNFKYQLGLVENKESAERPISVHQEFVADVLDHKTSVYSYEDKETTTYKDSSGRVLATADRPVTRWATDESYQIRVCFSGVALDRKDTFYAVLGTSSDNPKNLDDSDHFAAWKFTK